MAIVNVIYHHYPHYRAPVMRELAKSQEHSYRFWGSLDSVSGVKAFCGDELVEINPLILKPKAGFLFIKGYLPAVIDRNADALLVLGHPYMPATWIIAIAGRVTGKKVLFWTHGWLRGEAGLKRFLRGVYLRLAHKVLVYSERGKRLGGASGYPADRIDVIYNSLDFDRSQKAVDVLKAGNCILPKPQSFFEHPERPLVICTARITTLCRFDLLFQAASLLKASSDPINILLVGDGPERATLEILAAKLDVSVHFYGACYDEATLASLIYYSDVTVSPGKIGLTVIHSLTYGTPAITHGDLDQQMPEVEAITDGFNGKLFIKDDVHDLVRCMTEWFSARYDRETVRSQCQQVVAKNWNPARQRELIDKGVTSLLNAR